MENHELLCTAWLCKPSPCLPSVPNRWDLTPLWGHTGEASAPPQPALLLGPSSPGEGGGRWDGHCRRFKPPRAPRQPLSSSFAWGGTLCVLFPASPSSGGAQSDGDTGCDLVVHEEGSDRCDRCPQPGKSECWSVRSARDGTRGTSEPLTLVRGSDLHYTHLLCANVNRRARRPVGTSGTSASSRGLTELP